MKRLWAGLADTVQHMKSPLAGCVAFAALTVAFACLRGESHLVGDPLLWAFIMQVIVFYVFAALAPEVLVRTEGSYVVMRLGEEEAKRMEELPPEELAAFIRRMEKEPGLIDAMKKVLNERHEAE